MLSSVLSAFFTSASFAAFNAAIASFTSVCVAFSSFSTTFAASSASLNAFQLFGVNSASFIASAALMASCKAVLSTFSGSSPFATRTRSSAIAISDVFASPFDNVSTPVIRTYFASVGCVKSAVNHPSFGSQLPSATFVHSLLSMLTSTLYLLINPFCCPWNKSSPSYLG